MLKHFKVDKQRHAKVVDVEFYQMNLAKVIEIARKEDPELFIEDGIYLPSWRKFAKHPIKAKGFWSRMLSSMFLGTGGVDEVNVDLQFGTSQQRVAMMFLSIDNDEFRHVVEMTRDVLRGFRVVPISGAYDEKNATAEQSTWEEIQRAKRNNENVLILSAGMAQRSYSIPEITELYLAYDGGEAGATIQRMSRALTPASEGKVGRIVSLSFDPNRDDKFDQIILTTAENYNKTHNVGSLKEALRKVIATVDIFRCTEDGRDRFVFDTYLAQLLQNNSLSRIIGKTADITGCDPEMIKALAQGNADYFRNQRTNTTEKGKTHKPIDPKKRGERNTSEEKEYQRLLQKAREAVITVAENIDILVYGIERDTIEEALAACDNDPVLQRLVSQKFNVEYDVIRFLFDEKIINRDLVELMWENAR